MAKKGSKWGGFGLSSKQLQLGPRGLMLYVPLVLSLGLNSLWIANHVSKSPEEPSPHGLPKLQVNGHSCGGEKLQRVQDHLSDIVLIVSFPDDASARNASDFVREIYGRFFMTVVVCAPSEDEELGIEARGARSWGKNPSYQYYFFPKIASRYQQAAGFLFITADVVLNYWNLVEGDKNKIWLYNSPECAHCESFFVAFSDAASSAATANPLSSKFQQKAMRGALDRLEPEFRAQFEQSLLPSRGAYPTRVGDVFYVPQRLAFNLSFDLIPPFRDYGVFQDVAVPSMLYALESPDKYDTVLNNMVYRNANEDEDPLQTWTPEAPAYHPWNLITLQARAKLLRALAQVDKCLEQLLAVASSTPASES